MGIENAIQRMNELRGMVSAASTGANSSQKADKNSSNAFAGALQNAQQQLLGAGDEAFGAGNSMYGAGLPGMQGMPGGYPGMPGGYPGMPGGYGGMQGGYPGMQGAVPGAAPYGMQGYPGGGQIASPYGMSPYGTVGGSGAVAGMYPYGMMSPGQRIVDMARREIGVAESPAGSNDSPRIAQYRTSTAGATNTPGPWCNYFVSWLTQQAGVPIGPNGSGFGYVPTMENWAKDNNRYYTGRLPQPGDIAVFGPTSGGIPNHTGIVESVDPDGTIHTIEGNSSDKVSQRSRSLGQVRGFIRTY